MKLSAEPHAPTRVAAPLATAAIQGNGTARGAPRTEYPKLVEQERQYVSLDMIAGPRSCATTNSWGMGNGTHHGDRDAEGRGNYGP